MLFLNFEKYNPSMLNDTIPEASVFYTTSTFCFLYNYHRLSRPNKPAVLVVPED